MTSKDPELSISRQCHLLGISRSAYYYKPRDKKEEYDINMLFRIKEVLLRLPFYGQRRIACALKEFGYKPAEVRRVMKRFGLKAIFPGKNLSKAGKNHPTFPYLLKGMDIYLPNQVWATDITYIKIAGGTAYLVAIIDLFSRKILAWKLSNTMDVQFCLDVLADAIHAHGVPAIFNSDQGSQFTSKPFIEKLQSYSIKISMDGKGRCLDNVFIERFWRTLKYEDIYINHYENMLSLQKGVERYVKFYNTERFHSSLDYLTPEEVYSSAFAGRRAA